MPRGARVSKQQETKRCVFCHDKPAFTMLSSDGMNPGKKAAPPKLVCANCKSILVPHHTTTPIVIVCLGIIVLFIASNLPKPITVADYQLTPLLAALIPVYFANIIRHIQCFLRFQKRYAHAKQRSGISQDEKQTISAKQKMNIVTAVVGILFSPIDVILATSAQRTFQMA
jgi:hypothetical protein